MKGTWQYVLTVVSLALSGTTVAQDALGALESTSAPWRCEGTLAVTHAGGMTDTSKQEAQAIIRPNGSIEHLEVDLDPAMSQAKEPCGNGASCKVKRTGSITKIDISPATPTHPSADKSPGMSFYSESIVFDSVNGQLSFSGGGFEWGWVFSGKCSMKP